MSLQSIAIQSQWLSEGRPRHGPTHNERLRIRAAYKHAIHSAKKAPKQATWDRLHSAMEFHDINAFWKHWQSIHSSKSNQFPPVVDGHSAKQDIANAFKDSFMLNSQPNNQKKVDDLNHQFSAQYEQFLTTHSESCDCSNYTVSLENVIDAVFCMKQGKCSDDVGLHAEHFMNAPLLLFIKLASLFNYMLSHLFIPSQFRFGTIIPIIKDKHGDASDVGNYRGITISPLISKVFEHCLKIIFASFLETSSYQFGFKSKSSTNHALFSLKRTINNYIDRGSSVFCSFLDASKAFDRLVHSGLFF